MKNIIIIAVSLFVLGSAAKAQRTVSLRQHYSIIQSYRNSPDPVAAGLDEGDDITYAQDINNELNQFVGTWKGTNSNRNYEVIFVKKIGYRLFAADEFTIDLLKVWVTVKDNGGNILYTNTNKSENPNGFTGVNFQGSTNIYTLNFTGNCYNESDTVFIDIKSNGKMSLSFAIAPDIQSNDCPNGFTPICLYLQIMCC